MSSRSGCAGLFLFDSLELVLEPPHLLLETSIVRLQLSDPRLRRLEIVDADLDDLPPLGRRPALDQFAPAGVVVLDEFRCCPGR